MKQNRTCSKCKSDKVIPRVNVLDSGEHSYGNLNVAVYENPEAFLFKGTQLGALHAWICADCGFVEFYVDNPQELYEIYKKAQKNFS